MSDSPDRPWSNNSNAPQIPYEIYLAEKEHFAGSLMGFMAYGIVIILFFQCMSALLDPLNRKRGGIKWGLVVHTTAMFLLVTVGVALSAQNQLASFVTYPEFPGNDEMPPGPIGYLQSIYTKAITVMPTGIFVLNSALVDGFLLYRCYIIYAMNYWAIAFPCMTYLASVAIGIMFVFEISLPGSPFARPDAIFNFSTAYSSISFSLNVLLTLMIVVRLVWHSRNIRKALGASGATGLYTTVVTILVESFALYAVVFLLFFGAWEPGNEITFVFQPLLGEVQVIAPFLITLRVGKRTALTNDAIVSGNIGSIHFKSQGESASGGEPLPDADPITSMSSAGGNPSEFRIGAENSIDEVPR